MSSLTSTVLKALGVFGGVQGVNILAGIVRAKCAALWIGPEGVGIMALFVQTVMTISFVCQMGLRQSAVRDLSPLAEEGTGSRAARALAHASRMIALTAGVAGMLLTLILAPEISIATFGSADYAWSFRLLSLTILASNLTAADNAILQSFRELRKLARANLAGSVAGTAIIVCCLYFGRERGITGAVMALPLCLWLFSYMASRRLPGRPDPRPSLRKALSLGRGMIVLGLYLTVTDFITQFASYIFAIFLNREASTADVGIYQSGFTMVNQYVGVIFTAIAIEYYPRLSATIKRPRRTAVLVSHETAVALWVLMPFAVLFVCFDELMVRVLYSSSFLAMLPFISLAMAGVVFRAVSWCMAFVILAKGEGRIYLVTEVLSAVVMLLLYTTGWRTLGFTGLGIAYTLWYAVYTAIVYAVFRRRYGLRLGRGMGALILLAVAVCGGASVLRFCIGPVWTALLILPWLIPLSVKRLFKSGLTPSLITKRWQK
ncbi:MAG: oligosaccharide flippase family protein [Muribaculaceae bacterium]|nr:oligosaccharide flippase family protein [Muribaculaceae bacterium]